MRKLLVVYVFAVTSDQQMLIKLAITLIWPINLITFRFSALKNYRYCANETWFASNANDFLWLDITRHDSELRTSYKLKKYLEYFSLFVFLSFIFRSASSFRVLNVLIHITWLRRHSQLLKFTKTVQCVCCFSSYSLLSVETPLDRRWLSARTKAKAKINKNYLINFSCRMATLTEALFHGSNKRGFAHSRDYTAAFIVMVLVGKQHARLAFRWNFIDSPRVIKNSLFFLIKHKATVAFAVVDRVCVLHPRGFFSVAIRHAFVR